MSIEEHLKHAFNSLRCLWPISKEKREELEEKRMELLLETQKKLKELESDWYDPRYGIEECDNNNNKLTYDNRDAFLDKDRTTIFLESLKTPLKEQHNERRPIIEYLLSEKYSILDSGEDSFFPDHPKCNGIVYNKNMIVSERFYIMADIYLNVIKNSHGVSLEVGFRYIGYSDYDKQSDLEELAIKGKKYLVARLNNKEYHEPDDQLVELHVDGPIVDACRSKELTPIGIIQALQSRIESELEHFKDYNPNSR